jgi:cytochrome c-type biogenesis protein
MPTFDISLGAAFAAGLLSFVSPCVLPLVPAYLCFLGGVSLENVDQAAPRRAVTRAAVAFVAGFAAVFIALGASASAVGALVADHLAGLSVAAGLGIIVLGLHYCGLLRLKLLNAERRVHVARKPPGLVGAFVIGVAFAFGWTPCVGPILAAILMVAAGRETVSDGVLLLATYAAGIGVPFLVAALAMGPFLAWSRRFKRHMRWVEWVIGGLLIVTGVLILTGGIADVGNVLLDWLPILGRIG